MSRRKRRETAEWKWEQALIDDYYDHRWRQVLSPLCEQFKRWEAGELTHEDMDHAIHETHKQNQTLYHLFVVEDFTSVYPPDLTKTRKWSYIREIVERIRRRQIQVWKR